jgi:glutathione S-transferase
MLNGIGAMYVAPDDAQLNDKAKALVEKFEQLEAALVSGKHFGSFFVGARFCIVDAAFAPAFRYFDVFDQLRDFGIFDNTPCVNKWRLALSERESVRQAVRSDYNDLLREFLTQRKSALSRLIAS